MVSLVSRGESVSSVAKSKAACVSPEAFVRLSEPFCGTTDSLAASK